MQLTPAAVVTDALRRLLFNEPRTAWLRAAYGEEPSAHYQNEKLELIEKKGAHLWLAELDEASLNRLTEAALEREATQLELALDQLEVDAEAANARAPLATAYREKLDTLQTLLVHSTTR